MSFQVGADAYGRFMGNWSEPLAEQFADLAAPAPGSRALDVGCGPGALTQVLATRLGPDAVAAVDPSESFVSAARSRLPGVDVQLAGAEHLPFPDDGFDLTLAQLVVHFLADPEVGITEMARVTRPGGLIGACVWDFGGGRGPLGPFGRAVRDLDPEARVEADLSRTSDGRLVDLFGRVGLTDATQTAATVTRSFSDVQDWWQPFTLGVGPAGAYVATLDAEHRSALRARCAELLPQQGPFTLSAVAWVALARK